MYMPYNQGSSKLMIYFHGNAEDVGLATELLDYVRALLRVTIKIDFYRCMYWQLNIQGMAYMMVTQMPTK